MSVMPPVPSPIQAWHSHCRDWLWAIEVCDEKRISKITQAPAANSPGPRKVQPRGAIQERSSYIYCRCHESCIFEDHCGSRLSSLRSVPSRWWISKNIFQLNLINEMISDSESLKMLISRNLIVWSSNAGPTRKSAFLLFSHIITSEASW